MSSNNLRLDISLSSTTNKKPSIQEREERSDEQSFFYSTPQGLVENIAFLTTGVTVAIGF